MNSIIPSFKTTLLLATFLFFTLPMHWGFIAAMLLPIFVCVWIYDIVVMVRDPGQRLMRTARMAIWMLAFCAVGALNLYWYRESRAYADQIAAAVLGYKARTGMYPDTLEQMGIDSHESSARKWRISYRQKKGAPLLFYIATFETYDMFSYDFEARRWRYVAAQNDVSLPSASAAPS